MGKLRVLLVAAALLTAACGGAVIQSSSNAPASLAGVDVNAGANAGANADSDPSDITNRPKPPVDKGGPASANPPMSKPASVPVGEPAAGSGVDRCNGGIGTELSGTGSPGGPKQPLPECPVQ